MSRLFACLPATPRGSSISLKEWRLTGIQVLLLALSLQTTVCMAAETDFMPAFQAAKSRDLAGLDYYSGLMQGNLLGMYPEYWKLNIDLATQSPDAIESFAKRYLQSAIAEKLVADYIEAKAAIGEYDTVRRLAPYVSNPDYDENCAIVQGQAAGGDVLALSALRDDVWLKTSKISDLCSKVADQLLRSQLMTNSDRIQRLWTMARAGRVMDTSAAATALGIPLPPESLYSLSNSPQNWLATAPLLNATLAAVPPEVQQANEAAYLFALARLADSSTDMALAQLEKDANRLPDAVRQYSYRILAMGTLDDIVRSGFDPRALEWFGKSAGLAFSNEEAEAYARMAIRFSDWEQLLKALDAMSITKQQERIWQYWFARASQQRQSDPNAQRVAMSFYRQLAAQDDYYGLLARDQLSIETRLLAPAYQPTRADFSRLDAHPHFGRAFALKNMNSDASFYNREWNWAVRQAKLAKDDGLILAAAMRANQQNWLDRSIYATERTERLFNDQLRYPTPFKEMVVSNSNRVGLDAAWVYGLMRQESRFVMNARSNVGAGGLMQIMPDTARWVARRLGESFSVSQLSDMSTNIRYGTFYLSHIQGQLMNQPVLATAGYNAGPTRARRWQPLQSVLPADQYTETIPFLETRDYVKNVMTNAVHYGLVLGKSTESLARRMGAIPTQGGAIEGP